MKAKHFSTLIIASVLLLSSCTTYYIPVDSFRKQFAGLDTARLRRVTTKNPMGGKTSYTTYPVDSILCLDKNGTQMVLKNSPALEIRFTDVDDHKTVFYFDRIFISNDVVTGGISRVLPNLKSSVPLNKVKSIEIQNGGKRYSYVN